MPVWIRLCLANFNASAATSISFCTARVSAQIVGQVTAFEISITELKSPGLEIGKPASITSTPNASSCFATWIFSTVFNWHPGTCSPSRRVVSKINNLSLIILSFYFLLSQKKAFRTRKWERLDIISFYYQYAHDSLPTGLSSRLIRPHSKICKNKLFIIVRFIYFILDAAKVYNILK